MSTERVEGTEQATHIAQPEMNEHATPAPAAMPDETLTRFTLTVDADGRVTIPGTKAGETVTITVHPAPEADQPLGLAQTDRPLAPKQQALLEQTLERGRRVREAASQEWLALDHGELLYDENGLPR